MSKGGGGGGSTTTVQKADPWAGLQGPLTSLYGGAMNWYNSSGPSYYPGSTVAPLNDTQQAALRMGRNYAGSGQNPVVGAAQSRLNSSIGGIGVDANPAYGTLQPFAGGNLVGSNPAQGIFSAFANGWQTNNNEALPYLRETAGGKYLTNQTNPYLNGMLESASRPLVSSFQNAIAPALASQFSAAGRTGSGAQSAAFGQAADALGRNLSDLSSNLFGNAYAQERQLQQGAAGQLSQIDMTGQANQLAAAGRLSDINAAERAAQLRAAEDITGQYQHNLDLGQAAALAAPAFASSVQNMDFDKLAKLMESGQFEQNYQQQLIDANRGRYDYEQNLPLQKLQALNQLLQGGSAYSTTTSNGRTSQNRNPFAGAIGGAAMSNALGGMFGGEIGGAMMGPLGLLGGALLGGLFG